MVRMSLLALAVLPLLAQAQPYKRLVNQAAEALEEAEGAARRARGPCRQTVAEPLDRLVERTYRLRKAPRLEEVQALKAELDGLAATASVSSCPHPVLEAIQHAQESLEEVRGAAWKDRGSWRRDEDEERGTPAPPPGAGFAVLGPLAVKLDARFGNESAVRVSVPELRLTGLTGHAFYFGARFRSYEGPWSEWVTTQQWSVTQDPLTWRNPFNHFFRSSSLAEVDHAQGRFVAQVAVFDGQSGQVLATREASFRADVPRLPEPPLPPPRYGEPPPPQGPARDCDPGCTSSRDGLWPLDAAGFNGLQATLRATPTELGRSQVVQAAFQRNAVTAIQFGMLLDLFPNEGLKLSVARAGAARLVNPEYAVGYASKWANPAFQAQYVDLLRGQQPGQPPPPPPPPPPLGREPGPPDTSLPPGQYRDCGTGADPGCALSRNGTFPMDAVTYRGVLAALRATPNELSRKEYCQTVLQREAVTAQQLGALLEQFPNELVRLEVARAAAPRVVDGRHALGLAATFRNTLLGQEFARLMAGQP